MCTKPQSQSQLPKPISVKPNRALLHSRMLKALTVKQDMHISVSDLLAGLTQTIAS